MYLFKKHLSTTQMIIISFLLAIFVGTGLLALPFASADGTATPIVDALFTATTSVCVTGLVTVTTASHWSLFGQVVILTLIQIGGLGVVTMTMTILLALGKKVSLRNRMLLGDAFNLDSLKGTVRFLKKAFAGTFLVEGIGALLCMPVFISEYDIGKGIWYSVFHSVSAFCNAGIDVLGDSSLMPYVHNVWLNLVTMLLIILGGIGFVVWWDVLDLVKRKMNADTKKNARLSSLTLHTKIVVTMTVFLIIGGALLYLVFEYENPNTIGNFGTGEKILASLFQSVTTRTAGFATISQKELTPPSVVITLLLMFIGGSSVGTAGGVKTGTVAIILLSVWSTVKGQEDVTCFKRRISEKNIRKAVAVVTISFLMSLVALGAMLILEKGDIVDIIFEVYSAIGTVGISRDYTATVGLAGKIILCICMFLGRIGPIAMVIAFAMRDKQESIRLPEESVTVG